MIERTKRDITVRPLTRTDARSLYDAIRSSVDSLCRTLSWCHAGYSLQDAGQWVAYCESSWASRTELTFGIFDTHGAVIGGTGVSQVDRRCNMGNIGYWVSERCRGVRVGSAAARLTAEIGFSELGFTRLEIVVLEDNIASNRAAAR